MNSQNRMNAGAEYVLYRLWATLQDREGIHAESLLACLGALAGYACQAYVRQAGVKPDLPLTASPLSVWALIRRSLQKLGKPLPDIEDISAHVTRTLGTNEFGVPRIGDGRPRPRQLPVFYLMQLWPQVLPIAQRFCQRPAQLPVLFGIALQRALEHTSERLDPTIGASIAMECAVAMSKASLPAELSEMFQPARTAPRVASSPEKKGARRRIDAKTVEAGFFSARMRSVKVVTTVMSLAIVAVTSAAWKTEHRETMPATARVETKLNGRPFRPAAILRNRSAEPDPSAASDALAEPAPSAGPDAPVQQALLDKEAAPTQETLSIQASPASATTDEELPAPAPDQGEGIIAEDWQSA